MDNSFYCGLLGKVVTCIDSSYNEDRRGYNHGINQFPFIINYCKNEKDIQNAVIWAQKYNIAIRIRGGGHNYEGYSNGNYCLVIDLSLMKNIIISDKDNTVTIEGGVTNEDLYNELGKKGYPFPGGTCPSVGVFGYSLGGGWGLSLRKFGLGCDSIKEIKLINYQGQIILANEHENKDLFWAIKGGGGGNFGVVTSITFNLPPKISFVTLIEIDYENITSLEQEKVISAWQNYIKSNDIDMTLISRIYNSEEDGLSALVRGFYYGKEDEAIDKLKEFLDIEGAVWQIQKMPFIDAVNIIASAYPDFEKFKSASGFVYKKFTLEEINEIVSLIKIRPKGGVYIALSMYALGGVAALVNSKDTAFYHRNAHFIIWLDVVFEDDRYARRCQAWIDEKYKILEKYTYGAYVNFPYRKLNNYNEKYYGENLKKLLLVKEKYDPCNIFGFPQGLFGNNNYCFEETIYPFEDFSETPIFEDKKKKNYREFRRVKRKD